MNSLYIKKNTWKKSCINCNFLDHCCMFCLEDKNHNNVNGLSYNGDRDHEKTQKSRLGQIFLENIVWSYIVWSLSVDTNLMIQGNSLF